jgi:hypothetical protein
MDDMRMTRRGVIAGAGGALAGAILGSLSQDPAMAALRAKLDPDLHDAAISLTYSLSSDGSYQLNGTVAAQTFDLTGTHHLRTVGSGAFEGRALTLHAVAGSADRQALTVPADIAASVGGESFSATGSCELTTERTLRVGKIAGYSGASPLSFRALALSALAGVSPPSTFPVHIAGTFGSSAVDIFVTRVEGQSSTPGPTSTVLGLTDGVPWYLAFDTTTTGLDVSGVYSGPAPLFALVLGTAVFSPYW